MHTTKSPSLDCWGSLELDPLDAVEEVLDAHNWSFNRHAETEIALGISGKSCNYDVDFIWMEDTRSLKFICRFDIQITKNSYEGASLTMAKLNARLPFGHFGIDAAAMRPFFHYTLLLGGVGSSTGKRQIDAVIRSAFDSCEKAHSVFELLEGEKVVPNMQTLDLAIMDAAGRA